jgi:hypothetical protein
VCQLQPSVVVCACELKAQVTDALAQHCSEEARWSRKHHDTHECEARAGNFS